MNFQIIKKAAVDLLNAKSGGLFTTIGHQKQNKSADRINENSLVQVYYDSGSFPNTGGKIGPFEHDITLHIQLTVVAEAKADLATIDDPNSTVEQRAAAIQGILTAAENADDEIDNLISLVFGILMDAKHQYLLLPDKPMASRWIQSIKKDQTVEDGKYAVKTALILYTCNTNEDITGDPGVTPATVVMDTSVNSGDTEIGTEIQNVST